MGLSRQASNALLNLTQAIRPSQVRRAFGCSACTKPNSILEHRIMKEMVYTLAAWRVQEGRQQAFISAWKDLGEAFNSLSDPPGKGVLIQSTSDHALFYT